MVERTLTLRQLNRATLARQALLAREECTPLAMIERLAGLQAQLPNPPYIGLWTRLQDFERDDLTRLIEGREVVRATLMRSTLHLFSAQDYLLFRHALQPALTKALHSFFSQQAKTVDIDHVVAATRTYIEQQPRTFVELRAFLSMIEPDQPPELLAYVVRTHLPIVQIPPGGNWNFGGSPAHSLAESWLNQPLSTKDNVRPLILRYLAAFGPATVRDIQTWSGMPQVQKLVSEFTAELRTFRDESGKVLFDVIDELLPSEDTTAPPRFIPEYDNLILAHADRTRFMSEQYRKIVFLSAGRIRAVFLLDGFVAGTWKTERTRDTVTLVIEPFAPLSSEQQTDLIVEGEKLLHFMDSTAQSYDIQFDG